MSSADLTQSVWEIDVDDFPLTGDIEEKARFLLQYAILAPSSHNSQPWLFRVTGNEVDVGVDELRWLRTADPDKRELYISLGCAIENLCIAAEHFGFDPEVRYHESNDADYIATVTLLDDAELATPRPSELFGALTTRYTSHDPFDDRPPSTGIREELKALVIEDDISLHLVDDPETKTAISKLQAEADRLLMEDPAYRKELGHWIGLGALGNSWLMARIGQAVITHIDIGDREAAKNSKLLESAPVFGVLTTKSDASGVQVRTGQVFERLALRASTADLVIHPISQTLEAPDLRTRLRDLLPDGWGVPQHLFRLGYANETPFHTPRWPLETVLVEE